MVAENAEVEKDYLFLITGIQLDALNDPIRLYPNPTNSTLTIETGQPDQYSITITSLNGQVIYAGEMNGTSLQIDLGPFSEGVYFVTVQSEKYVTTEKVIKF